MDTLPTPAPGTVEVINRIDPSSPQQGPVPNYFAAHRITGRVRVFASEATAVAWATR